MIINKFATVTGVLLSGFALLALSGGIAPAFAQRSFAPIATTLDKTTGPAARASLKNLGALANIQSRRFVHLDLKILLDGKDKDAVLSSTEEAVRRYDVDCRPGTFGRLTMAEGVEYYVQVPHKGKLLKLSIYPGSRVKHTFNDVSCAYDPAHKDAAVFHIRGFYAVVVNRFPDGTVVQLRPVVPSTAEAAKVLQ